MTAPEIALRLIAGVALVGVNAFFVTTELALTRLPQIGASARRRPDTPEADRPATIRPPGPARRRGACTPFGGKESPRT